MGPWPIKHPQYLRQSWTVSKDIIVQSSWPTMWHPHFWSLYVQIRVLSPIRRQAAPDNKVHGAHMGPTWVLSAPDGPHVGPMNLSCYQGLSELMSTWYYKEYFGCFRQRKWHCIHSCSKVIGIFFCNVEKWYLSSKYGYAILRVGLRGVLVWAGKMSLYFVCAFGICSCVKSAKFEKCDF